MEIGLLIFLAIAGMAFWILIFLAGFAVPLWLTVYQLKKFSPKLARKIAGVKETDEDDTKKEEN